MEDRDVFPKYGVVNVGSLIGNESQLHVGDVIFVRGKRGHNIRRAKILMISENKNYIKDQKQLMEREDYQVKNVISACMRTIRDMNYGQMRFPNLPHSGQQPQGSASGASLPRVVDLTDDISGSDEETHYDVGRRHKRPAVAQNHYNRDLNSRHRQVSRYYTPNPRSRSMVCNTPVFGINGSRRPLLTFDQATQTDSQETIRRQKIDEMELMIKNIYIDFLKLVDQVQKQNERNSLNGDTSDAGSDNMELSEPEQNGNRSSPERVPNTNGEHLNGHPVRGEVKSNAKRLQVRRVSAHTTNTGEPSYGQDDMVPLGASNAFVPRSQLNTTPTGQLLQAMFPRRRRMSIYTNRVQHQQACPNQNQENTPPAPSSDESSTARE